MLKNATVRFVLVYVIPGAARAQALGDLTKAMQDGALTPNVAARFALDDVAASHRALEGRKLVGNVLVRGG